MNTIKQSLMEEREADGGILQYVVIAAILIFLVIFVFNIVQPGVEEKAQDLGNNIAKAGTNSLA